MSKRKKSKPPRRTTPTRKQVARQRQLRERIAAREETLNSVGAPLQQFFQPLGLTVDLAISLRPNGEIRDDYSVGGDVLEGWGAGPVVAQDQKIDQFVARRLARPFVESVTAHGAELWPGAKAFYSKTDHGFVLAWPAADIGFVLITPTHARIFHNGPTVRANFLLPGPHWRRLKRAIEKHEVERQSVAEVPVRHRTRRGVLPRVRVPLRILDVVPEEAPRATVNFLIESSRRLRLERQMVYGSPVVLEAAFGVITFEPIDGPPSSLVVPFRLVCPGGEVDGGIALSDESDPLRVELYRDELNDDMFVWSTALSGYADLTTWDLVSAARAGRRRGGGAGSGSRPGTGTRPVSGTAARRRLPRGARPHRDVWPDHLVPLGNTLLGLESVVAGHRRLLAPGWSPSAEAIERAARVGIRLAPEETWVRPHQRGGASAHELRFAWKRRRALATAFQA